MIVICGSVGTGRRARLRILWHSCRVGSSPIFRISLESKISQRFSALFLCNRKDLSRISVIRSFLLHKHSIDARRRNKEFHHFAMLRRRAKWDFALRLEGMGKLNWACPLCSIVENTPNFYLPGRFSISGAVYSIRSILNILQIAFTELFICSVTFSLSSSSSLLKIACKIP